MHSKAYGTNSLQTKYVKIKPTHGLQSCGAAAGFARE